jgi:hypothetical protein
MTLYTSKRDDSLSCPTLVAKASYTRSLRPHALVECIHRNGMIPSVFLVLLCRNFRESMQRKGKNLFIHSVHSTPEQGHFKKLTENKPPHYKPFLWSRLADYPQIIADAKKARKHRASQNRMLSNPVKLPRDANIVSSKSKFPHKSAGQN